MQTYIALLRGINVGGHKKIPMAELRALCAERGFADVRSYIQSGNLVFASAGQPAELEATLEAAIATRFGFPVDTLVRAATQWPVLAQGNPFPEASAKEPNLVLMSLAKRAPHKDVAAKLRAYATCGERVELVGEALWIHFPSGSGRSKLSPAVLDRLAGSPVTARNALTVRKIAEMIGEAGFPNAPPQTR